MRWALSYRYDPLTRKLADQHYNRQHVGADRFAPPGRALILRTPEADAFWISMFPYAEYVRHEWAGAWICTAFRNESPHLSSELIIEAVAATRAKWEPPDLGMITFVDPSKVRRKRDPGRCYLRAGFVRVGETKKHGLIALQLLPAAMPPAAAALGTQGVLA